MLHFPKGFLSTVIEVVRWFEMFGKHQFNEFIVELLRDMNKLTCIRTNGVLVNADQQAEKNVAPVH